MRQSNIGDENEFIADIDAERSEYPAISDRFYERSTRPAREGILQGELRFETEKMRIGCPIEFTRKHY